MSLYFRWFTIFSKYIEYLSSLSGIIWSLSDKVESKSILFMVDKISSRMTVCIIWSTLNGMVSLNQTTTFFIFPLSKGYECHDLNQYSINTIFCHRSISSQGPSANAIYNSSSSMIYTHENLKKKHNIHLYGIVHYIFIFWNKPWSIKQ